MTYYKCGSIHPTQNSNVVVDTASGAVANFQTPLAMPLKSLKIDVNAVQDLHGYDHPWPAGGGKNIGHFGADNLTNSQRLTINYTSDNSFTIETTGTYARHMYKINGKQGETVTVSFKGKGITTSGYNRVIFSKDGSWSAYYSYGTLNISGDGLAEYSKTFTLEDDYFYIGFYWTADVNVSETAEIQIFQVEYSSSKTSFSPYENICPINGWDEVNLTHCHKNLYQYDESKVAIGTTTTATTRAYYPLGFKGVTSLTFSASLKSGSSTTASDYLNIGILRKSDGLLEILSAFIIPAGITTRTLAISNDDKVVLMSLENPTVIKSILSRYDIQIEVGANASELEPYNGSTTLINLGGTYYGGYVSQDKDGKRELVVTHGYASYDLSKIPPNETTDGWDSWLIYRAERAESNPSSSVGKLCNCCPEYSYAGSQINRPHYYVSVGAFVMYLAENTYRNGYLEYTYPLETPFTVALPDGQPIKSFAGTNNIFCDTGDTSLQFRKIG